MAATSNLRGGSESSSADSVGVASAEAVSDGNTTNANTSARILRDIITFDIIASRMLDN